MPPFLCLLLLLAAAPAFAGEAAPLLVNSHVGLSLPAGWVACDERAGKLTSSAVPPELLEKQTCEREDLDHFLLFNTAPAVPGIIILFLDSDPGVTRSTFAEIPAAKLPAYNKAFCDQAEKIFKLTLDSCDVSIVPVSGDGAFVGTAKGRPKDGGARAEVRIVDVTYAGGAMLFLGLVADGDPTLDQVVESIAVR